MSKSLDTSRSLEEIEIALAEHFGFLRNTVVFNAHGDSWLFPLTHEADMLVLSPSRKLTEVEIKRSWSDFCADFRKAHHHEGTPSVSIERFYFAVPTSILDKVIARLVEERTVPSGVLAYDEKLHIARHLPLVSYFPEEEGKTLISTYFEPDSPSRSISLEQAGRMLRKNYFRMDMPNPSMEEAKRPVFLFDRNARPLFTEQVIELHRLGCLRQVSLRKRIVEAQKKMEEAMKHPDRVLLKRIEDLETLVTAYRDVFEKEVGYKLDEKEALFG